MKMYVLLVFTTLSLNISSLAFAQGGRGGKGRRDAGPVAVQAMSARQEAVPEDLAFVAVLGGRVQAEVYSKVSGRVESFGVAEGQSVKVGQVLLKIDRNEPGESFMATPVVAPFAGWIGRWHVHNVGEQVLASSPVVTVVDDVRLRAVLDLPVDVWLKVTRETRAIVKVGADSREAKIISISRSADMATARGTITIEIANDDHKWRAGMVARITLGVDPRPRITVPTTALIITDAGTYVYLMEGGKAKRTPVSFRLLSSDKAEVMEGVKDGDQVIYLGTNQISDGADVKPVER